MRRFGRVLLNVAVVSSLAVCLTMVALWARSFRTSTAMGWVWSDAAAVGVIFNRGELLVSRAPSLEHGGHRHRQIGWCYGTWPASMSISPFSNGWRDWPLMGSGPLPGPLDKVVIIERWRNTFCQQDTRTEWTVGGFRHTLDLQIYPDQTATILSRRLLIPRWFVVLMMSVFAVLPVARARSYWQRGRAVREGRCAVCNYDLRASPERCPECGTVVARGKA